MKNTTIRPLPGYVLVEPIEDEGKTASGLYRPDSVKDKPSKGKIIAIGTPTKDWVEQWMIEKKDINKSIYDLAFGSEMTGKIVVYKKWTNQEVESDGKKYLLVEFKDLLAIEE